MIFIYLYRYESGDMVKDLIRRGLKISHLSFMAKLAQTKKLTLAATELGITQPAASRLLNELERITNEKLYVRAGRGIELTTTGEALAYRCNRIMNEVTDAARDIDEAKRGVSGRVKIGAVTGPSIAYVLPAIKQMRIAYPGVSIDVEVATSDQLSEMLNDGDLDFALCRTPNDGGHKLFHETPMLDEPVSFVCRVGHPFTTKQHITTEELMNQDWILPPVGAILRTTVERYLRDQKIGLPNRVLSTSSFLFTLATIRNTNAIAPIAKSVADEFLQQSAISDFDPNMSIAVETYSLLTRRDQILTPAASLAKREVEKVYELDKAFFERMTMRVGRT